jgi:hypothetical protein
MVESTQIFGSSRIGRNPDLFNLAIILRKPKEILPTFRDVKGFSIAMLRRASDAVYHQLIMSGERSYRMRNIFSVWAIRENYFLSHFHM